MIQEAYVQGVSTRSVDDLVQAMGMSGSLNATWQRCRVHFMRNALVSAFIATAFAQDDAEAAKPQWRQVADQLKPKLPKLATLMHDAEADVLGKRWFQATAAAGLT